MAFIYFDFFLNCDSVLGPQNQKFLVPACHPQPVNPVDSSRTLNTFGDEFCQCVSTKFLSFKAMQCALRCSILAATITFRNEQNAVSFGKGKQRRFPSTLYTK